MARDFSRFILASAILVLVGIGVNNAYAQVAPQVSITSPASNSTFTAGSKVTIIASASASGGSISKVDFYNNSGSNFLTLLGTSTTSPYTYTTTSLSPGSYRIVALATDTNGHFAYSSGVPITVTGNSPTISITSPTNNSTLAAGSTMTITTAVSGNDEPTAKVYFYNGTKTLGSSNASPFSLTVSNISVGTYNLTAFAIDTNGDLTPNSSPVTITVINAPSVSITSPANNSAFTAGYTIPVTVTASENNGTVSKIALYNGTTLLGTSTASPYTFNWVKVPAGNYSLTAVATDANGVSTTSSPIVITVAVNTPVVSISSPGSGWTYSVGSNITISANASETNGTLSKVSFYNGKTLLGTSTTSPYSYSWTNVPGGSFILTAVATDAIGVSTTSTAVVIGVGLTTSITSPANNSTFTQGANVAFTASASEPNGTISSVSYYNYGTTLLGTSQTAPYSYTVNNISAGTYSIWAIARDANGVAVQSTNTVGFVVNSVPVVSITSPANGSTLSAGSNVAITATASESKGTITSVAFYNGTTLLGTVTSSPYTYNWNNVPMGTYSLTAKATDSSGVSTTSNPITLTFTSLPIITQQPVNATVIAPATATFTVTAKGYPAVTYQWMQSVAGANVYTTINGATSATYTTTATTTAISGMKYECIVTNNIGSVTSNFATLTVNAVPVITTQPVNSTVTAPATASFSVVATGAPAPTYQWQQELPGASTYTAISGATSAIYTTSATTVANSGTKYECVIKNSVGTVTSNAASLTVNVMPSITAQPTNVIVTAPATATFKVTATGTPVPTYQWQQELPGASSYTTISGATSATYTTAATVISNSGTKYECVVTNVAGNVTSGSAVLTVTGPLAVSITTPANNSTVNAGSNMTITASATETNGTISSVSFYNGTTLLGTSTAAPYSYTVTNVPVGAESLTATAIDARGNSITSSVVKIAVSEGPPTINLSTNDSRYANPATVTITATVAQVDGTVSRVDFYNGPNYLTSVSSAPFTYTWTNVPVGSYSLTANATNNNGTMTSSNTVNISVITPTAYIQSTSYNANGQITQIQYGNGTTTAYTYNSLNFRLMRIYTSNAKSQVIQDLNYTYDSVGQLLSITDNVNTGTNSMSQKFTYDDLNRLTSAQGAYGSKTYAYDALGNITQKDGLSYSYAGAGPHAVTSLSDGSAFTYDVNGNMVSLQKGSNTTNYVYDSQNHLQNVTTGGANIADYAYDGDGGRIKKVVYRRDLAIYNDNTNALLFGNMNGSARPATAQNATIDTTLYIGNLYEIETPSSIDPNQTRQTEFIYSGSARVASLGSDGNIFFYHMDHLGGTNVLTDQTGLTRELTEYDPFGQVTVHEKYGTDFATAWYYFTGKPLDDETGLIFLGARYYNPTLGRFITPDTMVQAAASSPQTLNRYSYCGNNPINAVDPTGHSWTKFWHSFIGAFVGALVTVLTGGLGAPVAFALGGLVSGAITGGLNGGLQGALVGGIMGGALGGLGGYGYQLSQAAGTAFIGNAIMGGLAAGGIGYTAATGNWSSFAGGLAGYGASQVAVGVGAAFSEHLQVEGNPQTATKFDVMGILQNEDKAALSALHASNSDTAFFYQNSNGFIADLVRAGMAKFFGVSQAASDLDGYIADGVSSGVLQSVNAHSEGTILLADALEHSSSSFNKTTFSFNGPAILQTTAEEAVSHVNGIMNAGGYAINDYDPIGVLTTMNPFKMAIYAGAGILTGARYHAATTYPNMGINVGEGVGG